MAASPAVTTLMSASALVAPRPAHVSPSCAPAVGPTYGSSLMPIPSGVGSRPWTNALAVNTKAAKAFRHGPRRLLEHST
ncbi:MAG: hypothetical protein AB7H43_00480 [Acidimicrobiia bacterium]